MFRSHELCVFLFLFELDRWRVDSWSNLQQRWHGAHLQRPKFWAQTFSERWRMKNLEFNERKHKSHINIDLWNYTLPETNGLTDPEFKTMFEKCFVEKMPATASKTAHFKCEHPRLLKRAVCQKTTTNWQTVIFILCTRKERDNVTLETAVG